MLGFAALVMLASTLPYLIGYASQGSDWVFTGFVFGVEDGNSYLAKMLSGAAGAWTFRTPYTAYPQRGIAAFLPYLLLGKLAAPPGLQVQLAVLFHLFRIASGFLAVLATYDFLAFFLRGIGLRRFGLALAALGGGMGWVLVFLGRSGWLGSLPLEFYSPETFGFLSLYGIPHLALARAGLLWGLLAYLQSAQAYRTIAPRNRPVSSADGFSNRQAQGNLFHRGIRIGFFWLLTALAQPLTALVFGGLIALHLLITALWLCWRRQIRRRSAQPGSFDLATGAPPSGLQVDPANRDANGRVQCHSMMINSKDWQRWKSSFQLACWGALLPAPFLLYNALVFSSDPFIKAWTAQNRILSPHPLHYLLAYGLLAPFLVEGSRRLCRRRPWEGLFLISWVCALPFLAYAPLNLQRRLPEGIWVAAVVLALAAFEGRKSGLSERALTAYPSFPRYLVRLGKLPPPAAIPLLLAFPSTLLLLSGGILAAMHPAQPVFRPAQEVEAFQYLQENAGRGEVVLCSYQTGNALPAWAPVRTVIGHGPESVNLAGLLPHVAGFYSNENTPQARIDFLRELSVSYLFWGPLERSLGDWDPEGASYLQRVYSSSEFQIYKVNLPQ